MAHANTIDGDDQLATHRDLFDPSDSEQLQSEQRLAEVSAIFAAGVIRMREKRGVGSAQIIHTRPEPGRGAARAWAYLSIAR